MLPLIAAKLYCEPWACLPEVHSSICSQFRAHIAGGITTRLDATDPVGPEWDGTHYHPQVQKYGPLALLQINGVIGKHLSTLEMQCGGYDLALLGQQLENIGDDPAVRTLVISINSPGGIAQGVELAARQIRALADSGVRVIGYTDGQACSAAYWLAAACDQFHAEGSAIVGSISTYAAGIDSSRMWEMDGLELKLFRTGDIKAIGMAGKPWTPEEEQFMAAKVASVDSDFKFFVAARRGLTPAEMNGAFWPAKHAPSGLVDSTAFGTLQSLLQSLLAP